MKFTISVKWSEIENARKSIVVKHRGNTQVKGFRKGKAPTKLVENKIGEQHIIEDVLDQVLPKAYAEAITAKKLKPLTMPKITPTSIKPQQDWEFDVEIAEKPEVVLGDYKKYLKTTLIKVKEPTKEELAKNPDHDSKLVAIFDALLEKTKCEVPPLLIEQEVNDQLNHLVSQIEKMGITLEKYLESTKMTLDALKANYQKTATANIKLEFVLQKLIEEHKVKIEENEIDALINSIGDDHAKTHLNTPREREAIRYMLAKRKTIDILKTL